MRYASSIRNILGHFRGLLIEAIKEEKYLSKLMVFLPDADIITQTGVTGKEGIAEMMGYLLEIIHRQIQSYAEKLDQKWKKKFFPHVLWITPPQHKYFANNESGQNFTDVMNEIVQKPEYGYMACLSLKKIWDEKERGFYTKEL